MSSDLTFTFTEEIPEQIHLGWHYIGPKNPKMAEYNSGEGWKPCPTEKDGYARITLPIHSNQISFRGDWRRIGGRYDELFKNTFSWIRNIKDVIMSGTLEHDANNTPRGYVSLFSGCNGIVYMRDNPIPKLKGILAPSMLKFTFSEMRSLTSLPEGFLDMSEMHGEPGGGSFFYMCDHMDISFPYIFKISRDIQLSPQGIAYIFLNTWAYMKNWTGTVLWGDKVLFNEIVPDRRVGAILGCNNMIGYKNIHKNWKG